MDRTLVSSVVVTMGSTTTQTVSMGPQDRFVLEFPSVFVFILFFLFLSLTFSKIESSTLRLGVACPRLDPSPIHQEFLKENQQSVFYEVTIDSL